MDNAFLKKLRRIVGTENVADTTIDAAVYAYDGSLATGAPDAIVFPASTGQTSAVVRAAYEAGVPCIPRGFGTNLSGGSVAPHDGVVLCFSRMNRILDIQPDRRLAVAEPGVTNLELQNALAPLGFFYAPDPASQEVSTLGGNIAENAGGPHCVKHGVTTNHVLGLELVLPDGETLRLGGSALDPPGLDLRGLIIGSEGTLGTVTEVTVRVLPKPQAIITFLAIYESIADAARSVSAIIAKGIVPATLEMMDQPVIRAVEESYPTGLPTDAAAILIIEVEGLVAGLQEQAEHIHEICNAHGCRSIRQARDDAERDSLWAGRRGALGALARIAPSFLVSDCTVPRNRLPEALARGAEIAQAHGFMYGNVFHAGDGNLHPLFFFDAADPEQMPRVHQAGLELMEACVALGGTITGEHGVGVEKRDAMRMVFSEDALDLQRTVRRVFDPRGLCNPGKLLPEPNGTPPDKPAAPAEKLPPDAGRLTPASVDEACDMVLAAIAGDTPLLPLGGGRRADFGNLPSRELRPISTRRLIGVVEHDVDNQTVTFAAGTPLADAQEVLAGRDQWLPFRPPLGDGTTMGGLVALGCCGPDRLAHGAPRDRLLGVRFVSGLGKLISVGGRVVKNVAGYDLSRLLAGSAGTLGLITEATFRVAAIPNICRTLVASGTLDQCAEAAAGLLRSNLEPIFVAATAEHDDPGCWTLAVGFEGFEVTIAAQQDGAAKILRDAGLDEHQECDYALRDGLYGPAFEQIHAAPFVLRADVPVGTVAHFLDQTGEALAGGCLLADFGCGRVTAGLPALSDDAWTGLTDAACALGGHVIAEKASQDFKAAHGVFGPPRPSWRLMHRVKAALDPHALFAPGRLPRPQG